MIILSSPLVIGVLAITPIAISAPGGIDLSIGPLIAIINVGIVQWLVPHGLDSWLLVFAFSIGFGVVYQLIQGLLIGLLRLQPVIVTLSGYLVLGGMELVILPQPGGAAPAWLANWGSATSTFSPVFFVVVGCFVAWTLFSRTAIARNIRLMGGNERTAFVSGVRLLPTRLIAHVVAGVFAGVAGVLLTAVLQSADPTGGSSQTLMIVTALLIGGTSLAGGKGRALGSLLGALDIYLIGFVLATFQLGESSGFVTEVIYGSVLIGSLLIGGSVSALKGRKMVAEVGEPA